MKFVINICKYFYISIIFSDYINYPHNNYKII